MINTLEKEISEEAEEIKKYKKYLSKKHKEKRMLVERIICPCFIPGLCHSLCMHQAFTH